MRKQVVVVAVIYSLALLASGVHALTPTFIGQPDRTTRTEPLSFFAATQPTPLHKTSAGVQVHTQTFRSEAMPLKPGEVVFTDPTRTKLQMPPGKIAIRSYHAEVVDANNVSVPLDEVYNHHWLVFNGKGNGGVCGGYLTYVFGVGAESRGTTTAFPSPHALVADGSETWTANIHLLRTVGTTDTKNCIECGYAPQKGCAKKQSGLFPCCQSGSFCTVDKDIADDAAKEYYLQYIVTWTEVQEETKPIEITVLDASNCEVEYNIEASKTTPIHTTQFSWTNPKAGHIVYGVGHQHIGAINISLAVNGENVCTNVPRYGTEQNVAGNEKGYVVAIPPCDFSSYGPNGLPVARGDKVTVTALYDVDPDDPRSAPLPGGSHGGVMALFYLATTH